MKKKTAEAQVHRKSATPTAARTKLQTKQNWSKYVESVSICISLYSIAQFIVFNSNVI